MTNSINTIAPAVPVSSTVEYIAYSNMIRRCYDEDHPQYKDYGGRGITVCVEWRASFETFRRDMGKRPNGHSIDRRDNNKGYSKDNCRWTTRKVQNFNRRVPVAAKRDRTLITINGITKSKEAWCADHKIAYSTVFWRMTRKGISFEDALKRESAWEKQTRIVRKKTFLRDIQESARAELAILNAVRDEGHTLLEKTRVG